MKEITVNVGVIGCGYWGPNLIRNFHNNPEVELAAIADVDQSRLERIGGMYPAASRHRDHRDLVKDNSLDAVVVATGAGPSAVEVPGIDQSHVFTGDDYIRREAKVGDKVVVLGGDYGAELALSVARDGKQATLISDSASVAAPPYNYLGRMLIMQSYLEADGVEVLTEDAWIALIGG